MNELFAGAQGTGATLNGAPLHVSSTSALEDSLLATGFSYDRRIITDNNYTEFCRLTDLSQGVRRAGAASLDLAYVAAGRLDGYWERGLQPWDMAAGVVLVKEAGGIVTDYDGKSLDVFQGRALASNPHIHPLLSRELIQLRKDRKS